MEERWFSFSGGLCDAVTTMGVMTPDHHAGSGVKLKTKWIILATLGGFLLVAGIGLFAFIYSGIYDMSAIHPHENLVRNQLLILKRNSVEYHARNLQVPAFNDPQLIKRGFILYRQNCVTCHGAPGEGRSHVGRGLNPNPPPLEKAAEDWTSAEIAWIISNGLKMAGMPGFALGEQSDDLWALTAFVIRMNVLAPAEYRAMLAATQGEGADEEVAWLSPDQGWASLHQKGSKRRGEDLIREFGCGTCHQIPGIAGANGKVGPPLNNWAKRHYIAGALINTPKNLVPWIMNPQQVEPGTVMPNLGISEEQARDIARFLYSIGEEDTGAVRRGVARETTRK